MKVKSLLKDIAGHLPLTAELKWALRHRDGRIQSRFRLPLLEERGAELLHQLETSAISPATGRQVFLFASSHAWLMHILLVGLTLRGLGYRVKLGYLPYGHYDRPVNRFDLRLQDLYARHWLRPFEKYLEIVPFLSLPPAFLLPAALQEALEQITLFDTQYIRQSEDISPDDPIYALRAKRNQAAARRALAFFRRQRPDVVIVPNGMIQEYAAVYEAARFLAIPAVTYEFGEHNHRIWLGQNRLVIHHQIDELWASRKERKLTSEQRRELEEFLAGRQGLSTGEQFAHLWQKTSPEGGKKIRAALGLDKRPVVLLPTNVLGDSATLGLTVFSRSMSEWLQRVLVYLARRTEVQVLVRIHPAETWTVGPSVAEIIQQVLPQLPPHIRLIGPKEKINTYDLMDIADLALVYTTTAGLEMAVRGLPVLVSGRAHYRGKGFTLEADSWDEYFAKLDTALKNIPQRLTPEQVEQAWNYAYTFFREYPRPFPWHLEKIGQHIKEYPLSLVLSEEGRVQFETTFRQLAGERLSQQTLAADEKPTR
ncbi:MAG: capsular biosynthesis protein [Anaerolineales bacterium]|nr:capsular biosynthesis protein [Anaerolineales bacterium]